MFLDADDALADDCLQILYNQMESQSADLCIYGWYIHKNDLKSRGVLDVYLFCTDGLCGMPQAIQAVYPKSRLQRCIVHQIRSSTKYVSYKDIKQLAADLKKIYTAVTEEEATQQLDNFAEDEGHRIERRLQGRAWRA